jgi:peptidoglycan DL-endopeptidase CwlO
MKRVFSLVISALILLTPAYITYGSPLNNSQKEQAENQLKQNEEALKTAEKKLLELEIAIQKFDRQIEGLMEALEQDNESIIKKEAEIKVSKENVQAAEKDMKEQQQLFDKRVRAMYKNGPSSYLGVILKSENLSDLVSKLEAVSRIVDFDKKVAEELLKKRDVLIDKQLILEKENQKLLQLKSEKESKLKQLNNSKKEQQVLVDEAKKQRNLQADKVKKDQEAVNAAIAAIDNQAMAIATNFSSSEVDIKAAIDYLKDRSKKINSSKIKQAIEKGTSILDARKKASSTGSGVDRGASNGTISGPAIIMYAQKFLGTPYKWGGARPYVAGDTNSGFDCSGLVQYVYKQFGIFTTRTTYTQIKYDGKQVSKDSLKAGDLIFFGSWEDPYHVGLYVGDGNFIHAPRTGDVIKISPLSERSDYLVAKRIIN